MQVGSIGGYGGLWDYKYKNAVEANAGAFAQEICRQVSQGGITDENEAVLGVDGTDDQDPFSYQKKVQDDREYREKLADAKVNDPEKYYELITARQQDIAKSFSQLEELAGKSGGKTGTAEYQGIPVQFDFENNSIFVGDASSSDIIHAGRLSNGYSFSFSRDSIDAVAGMLDLFSPEDVNQILEAITKADMKDSMERECDAAAAKAVQTAENAQDETAVQDGEAAQDGGDEAQQMPQNDLIDALFTDRDAAVEAPNGMGGSGMDGQDGQEKSEEEESQTTSEIVVNSDGTRNLIIKVKVGGQEIITKMPLSVLREHDSYHRQQGVNAYELQLDAGVSSSYQEQNMMQNLETA